MVVTERQIVGTTNSYLILDHLRFVNIFFILIFINTKINNHPIRMGTNNNANCVCSTITHMLKIIMPKAFRIANPNVNRMARIHILFFFILYHLTVERSYVLYASIIARIVANVKNDQGRTVTHQAGFKPYDTQLECKIHAMIVYPDTNMLAKIQQYLASIFISITCKYKIYEVNQNNIQRKAMKITIANVSINMRCFKVYFSIFSLPRSVLAFEVKSIKNIGVSIAVNINALRRLPCIPNSDPINR